MTVIREYSPAECDEHGIPLGWEKCEACRGTGYVLRGGPSLLGPMNAPCPTCNSHGSLKAAVLAELAAEQDE